MILNIKRFNQSSDTKIEKFEVPSNNETILNGLIKVKQTQDASLTFRCGCGSGVCGSCAIRVNGTEKLACKTTLQDNDLIEPLNYTSVIKDLVVDLSFEKDILSKPKAYLQEYKEEVITPEDEQLIDRQSNCILCQSCYSSCPVLEVNKDFLGPYALSRVLRYVNDKKEHQEKEKIDLIQTNGIWDCTLCGNCTMVCPQQIDPKMDIMNLRMKSMQWGYKDPNVTDYNTGVDFGFNPNSF